VQNPSGQSRAVLHYTLLKADRSLAVDSFNARMYKPDSSYLPKNCGIDVAAKAQGKLTSHRYA